MRLESPTAAPADVQTFTADGTWAMPAGASSVQVIAIGAGGSGGPGWSGTTGTFTNGGSGGSGAGWSVLTFPAAGLTATVAVTVGVPVGYVTVGSGWVIDSASSGTQFGDYVTAAGGVAGFYAPEDVTPSGFGRVPAAGSMIQGQHGGYAGWSGDIDGRGPSRVYPGCPGGGGGGSLAADGSEGYGGNGRGSVTTAINEFTPGGEPPGGAGTDGADVTDAALSGPGSGGAGGAASATGAGGAGGAGGSYGGGGGGGGAAITPNLGGAGGLGGPGICVVITYF